MSRPITYVALGDSFTEGLDDRLPSGQYAGWADLVASRVPGCRYANLAVRGKLLGQIADEQVPRAVALQPDLVTLAGGGNDLLRSGCDVGVLELRLRDAATALRATGARVLLFTGADVTTRMPGTKGLRPAIVDYCERIRAVAADTGCDVVDVFAIEELHDRRFWSQDRLHLSRRGHERVAAEVLAVLGHDPEPAWSAVLPAAAPQPWHRARADDVVWLGRHVAPWVYRRVRGRSSGDGVLPKRPEPLEVDAPA